MLRIVCATLMLIVAGSLTATAQMTDNLRPPVPRDGRADAAKQLAPTGKLRVAINLGNIVLAQKDASGNLTGVSVDLARELGRRLSVPVEFTPFDAAGKAFDAFKTGALDIVFLAIEPVRANEVAFTPPYVLIEGVYLVPKESPLKSVEDVDRPGTRIGVNTGSAYDLYLTRTLKQA